MSVYGGRSGENAKNVVSIYGYGHPTSDIWILGCKVMSVYGGCWWMDGVK